MANSRGKLVLDLRHTSKQIVRIRGGRAMTRPVQKGLLGGNSEWEPPDPFSNSEVKTLCADDSVDFVDVKVGHCQALNSKAPSEKSGGAFSCAPGRAQSLGGESPLHRALDDCRLKWQPSQLRHPALVSSLRSVVPGPRISPPGRVLVALRTTDLVRLGLQKRVQSLVVSIFFRTFSESVVPRS